MVLEHKEMYKQIPNQLCYVKNVPVSSGSPAKPVCYPAPLLCPPRMQQVKT